MKHRSALTGLIAASGLLGMAGTHAGATVPPLQRPAHGSAHAVAGSRTPSVPAHPGAQVVPVRQRAQRQAASPHERRAALLSAAVIADRQLADARGGTETPVNQNTTTGAVAGNVASQLTTGSNAISNSAFSNTAGIPIVIQNTGNNVLIQNSTILNLQLTNPQ